MTFKHAVEFSSFGCAPRSGPGAVAWGNSTYFTGACARCQTELSCPSRPRQTPGLGGSWHGGTPYPYCFGLGFFRHVRPRSLRAVRLTEKAWTTLRGPRLGVKPSLPTHPHPRRRPGLGGSWHGGTPYPYCFGLGSLRHVHPESLRAVRLTGRARRTLRSPRPAGQIGRTPGHVAPVTRGNTLNPAERRRPSGVPVGAPPVLRPGRRRRPGAPPDRSPWCC